MLFNEKYLKMEQLPENTLYRQGGYTKEELEKFYYKHYLFNLRNILFDDEFYFIFRAVDELTPAEPAFFQDIYIRNMSDETSLAKDIMKNGTYWPLRTYRNPEGKIIVDKGIHRVLSAQKLQAEGGWDGRKLLCIESRRVISAPFNSVYNRKMMLKNPVRMRIPITALFPDYEDNSDFINEMLAKVNGTIIDNLVVELDVYSYRDFVKLMIYMPKWLREPFYHSDIKPMDIINDQDVFEQWKRRECDVL